MTAWNAGIVLQATSAYVAIDQAGSVTSGMGVCSAASFATFVKGGKFTGDATGPGLMGDSHFVNTGTVVGSGSVIASGANDEVANSGTLAGKVGFFGGTNTVTNAGEIRSVVELQESNNRVHNSGQITDTGQDGVLVGTGSGFFAINNILISNSGSIAASLFGVRAFGTNLKLANSGEVQGGVGLDLSVTRASALTHQVFNHGLIEGNVTLFNDGVITGGVSGLTINCYINGLSKVVNAGSIVAEGNSFTGLNITSLISNATFVTNTATGLISGGVFDLVGSLSLRNLGLIEGLVPMGDGADIYDGRGGTVTKAVIGVVDRLTGSVGEDILDGGADSDTLDIAGTNGATTVNLDLGLAFGAEIGSDKLVSFENVIGSTGADSMAGDEGANILQGNSGADTLVDADGRDMLDDGAGADSAIGGARRVEGRG